MVLPVVVVLETEACGGRNEGLKVAGLCAEGLRFAAARRRRRRMMAGGASSAEKRSLWYGELTGGRKEMRWPMLSLF